MIYFNKVNFRYPSQYVLRDISFKIEQGDFVAIIGSNGAGKSTLLKLVLGELDPMSGNIQLFGQEIAHFKDWPKIGYAPQNPAQLAGGFPATVMEIVLAGLYSKMGIFAFPNKHHRKKALESLTLMGVDSCANKMIGQLSGGQLQRVMIARAMVADCKMLVLDEPDSGVDPAATQLLYQLLERLNSEQNITVIMVTHDTSHALNYARRTFCLECATLVELDKKQLEQELAGRHTHPVLEEEA